MLGHMGGCTWEHSDKPGATGVDLQYQGDEVLLRFCWRLGVIICIFLRLVGNRNLLLTDKQMHGLDQFGNVGYLTRGP